MAPVSYRIAVYARRCGGPARPRPLSIFAHARAHRLLLVAERSRSRLDDIINGERTVQRLRVHDGGAVGRPVRLATGYLAHIARAARYRPTQKPRGVVGPGH